MNKSSPMAPVNWYWPPIDRELLGQLSRKSDLRGFMQTLGFLAVLALTAGIAYHSGSHWPWYVTAGLLLVHGTCWAFLSNGFHELIHGTVFATRWLNRAFLGLFSVLGWNNPVLFWASHTEHHKYTLHPAGDLEIDVDASPTLRGFMMSAVVNPLGLYRSLGMTLRHAFGKIEGAWEQHLFPPSAAELRSRLALWARILLVSHALVIAIAIYWHLWILIVVVSLAKFYGGGVQWLCNEAQHTGLPGDVDDFRLCSRTIYLNPLLEFMYWHMNYHTEHHMYAAVPCYRLVRLHAAVKSDMPACPSGLVASWRLISAILMKKKLEPGYQHLAPVPTRRTPGRVRSALPRQTVS